MRVFANCAQIIEFLWFFIALALFINTLYSYFHLKRSLNDTEAKYQNKEPVQEINIDQNNNPS